MGDRKTSDGESCRIPVKPSLHEIITHSASEHKWHILTCRFSWQHEKHAVSRVYFVWFQADICNQLDLWMQLPLCMLDCQIWSVQIIQGEIKSLKFMKQWREGGDPGLWLLFLTLFGSRELTVNLLKSLSQFSPVQLKTSPRMGGCLWMIHHGGNFSPQPESIQTVHAKFKVTCTKESQLASNYTFNWYIGGEKETWSQSLQISLCCGINMNDKKRDCYFEVSSVFCGRKAAWNKHGLITDPEHRRQSSPRTYQR